MKTWRVSGDVAIRMSVIVEADSYEEAMHVAEEVMEDTWMDRGADIHAVETEADSAHEVVK